jgi:hypothetical protein
MKNRIRFTAFYENAGEVVAVDIKGLRKIQGSGMRDLRDRGKYLVNPVYPV